MTLALIGTAGRGDDAKHLTAAHWRMMTCIAQSVACALGVDHLVSGGSAWADAVAVDLFLGGHVKRLTLHLPARFENGVFEFTPDGNRLNALHLMAERATRVDHLAQIRVAIEMGAEVHVNPGGFKARNTDVANDGNGLLAFTFSGGRDVADGGTADTTRKWLARRAALDQLPVPHGMRGFHFDLVGRQLYTL